MEKIIFPTDFSARADNAVFYAAEPAPRKNACLILNSTLENTNWGMAVQYETKIKYSQIKNTIPQLVREAQAGMLVKGNHSRRFWQPLFRPVAPETNSIPIYPLCRNIKNKQSGLL